MTSRVRPAQSRSSAAIGRQIDESAAPPRCCAAARPAPAIGRRAPRRGGGTPARIRPSAGRSRSDRSVPLRCSTARAARAAAWPARARPDLCADRTTISRPNTCTPTAYSLRLSPLPCSTWLVDERDEVFQAVGRPERRARGDALELVADLALGRHGRRRLDRRLHVCRPGGSIAADRRRGTQVNRRFSAVSTV